MEATAQVVSYNRPAEMYGQPMAMPERRISLDTVKKYGVTVETVPNGHEAFKHHYPYYDMGGQFIGTKARRLSHKSFSTPGNMKEYTLCG